MAVCSVPECVWGCYCLPACLSVFYLGCCLRAGRLSASLCNSQPVCPNNNNDDGDDDDGDGGDDDDDDDNDDDDNNKIIMGTFSANSFTRT